MKYKIIKLLVICGFLVLVTACGGGGSSGSSSSSSGTVNCVLGTGTLDNCTLE